MNVSRKHEYNINQHNTTNINAIYVFFLKWGGTPIAGWFIENSIKMDDDWGYPHGLEIPKCDPNAWRRTGEQQLD